MNNSIDDREVLVLECIRDSDEPIGSWALVDKLEQKGFKVSSASMGRILYRLETIEYVAAKSNKGRIITPKGIQAIARAKANNTIKEHRLSLEKLINTHVLDEFIMVLQARKAIERETMRLAAAHITHAEIAHLKFLIDEQEKKAAREESIAEIDIAFHKAIAEASRNAALAALYGLLAMMGQQSELFEYVRSQVNATYRKAHRSILEALIAHNADKAEECVIKHMDALIEDVKKYWDAYRGKTPV